MVYLRGLTVDEFMHPKEKNAWQAIENAKWLKALLKWSITKEAQYYVKTDLLGYAFSISRESNPEIYDLVEEVCKVLDYDRMPKLYCRRSFELCTWVNGGNEPVICYSDFVFNTFDKDMIRFMTGRAITRLKTGNAELRAAAVLLFKGTQIIPFVGTAAAPLIAQWLRNCCLTEDRGALLACQDLNAAMKAMLTLTGAPETEVDPAVYPEYIEAYKSAKALENVSQSVNSLFMLEPWKNDRIVELFRWHSSGAYADILEEYE